MQSQGNEMRRELEALRDVLAGSVAGAEKILNRMENPSQLERFKESLLEMTMEFVVGLDMAAGEIHRRRQNLLESQMADIAGNN
ncbi:MAG: hypothetical protein ACYTGH_11260 [Planctomycetota bacterium]|jgi:hypothetical protein